MQFASFENILLFIISTVFLFLSFSIFILFTLRQYQKKKKNYTQEITALKIKHENELLQTQIEIQETTFQNISREIHDNIGQKLTLAKLQLTTLLSKSESLKSEQIKAATNMISESIIELSDISRSLSSELIVSDGLFHALNFTIDQIKKTGFKEVKLKIFGSPIFLTHNQELFIFRIIQEALNNIIKHAEANSIKIVLYYRTDFLILEIRDNGKGFDLDKKFEGNGLKNIKRRASILNGEASFFSKPGKTKIYIKIPIYGNTTVENNSGR
jgi:signal transduction histidine kinase